MHDGRVICVACGQPCFTVMELDGLHFCSVSCKTCFDSGVEYSRREEQRRTSRRLESVAAACLQTLGAMVIAGGLLAGKQDVADVGLTAAALAQDIVELIDIEGNADLRAQVENLEATVADLRDALENRP